MTSFKAALINEWDRMFRKKKIVIFTGLNLLVCLVSYLLVRLMNVTQFRLTSIDVSLNLLSIYCSYILPVYIVMECLELFSTEYANGTIRNILIRPISRLKIYGAKLTALGSFILLNLLLVLVLSLIIGQTHTVSVSKIIIAYLVSIYPLLTLGAFVALVAQVVRNGLFSMLLCYILLLGAKAAEIFYITQSAYLFTTYLDWYKMFIMSSVNFNRILTTIVFIGAYGVIFFVAGYVLFDKKEF